MLIVMKQVCVRTCENVAAHSNCYCARAHNDDDAERLALVQPTMLLLIITTVRVQRHDHVDALNSGRVQKHDQGDE